MYWKLRMIKISIWCSSSWVRYFFTSLNKSVIFKHNFIHVHSKLTILTLFWWKNWLPICNFIAAHYLVMHIVKSIWETVLFSLHGQAMSHFLYSFTDTDLHNVIKKGNILKDVHKRYIIYQLLKACKYMHSGNVIHRDQKVGILRNVLLLLFVCWYDFAYSWVYCNMNRPYSC